MNNDLGFLVLFIILPTVLVVSGFWLALYVRDENRRPQASNDPIASQEAATDEAPALDVVPAGPVPSVAPMSKVPRREEFWTPIESMESPEPVDDSPTPTEASAEQEPESKYEDTAKIEPLDHVEEAAPAADNDDVEPDQSDSEQREEDETSQSDQRKPTARMVPSSDNVARRTGAGTRKATPLLRSLSGDKDVVERPDGV